MNQAMDFEANLDQQLSLFIGAFPVLIPIFRQLNVVSIINRYCPCEADIDEGTVALILALNRLMSPRPLYKVSSWMAETVLQETLDIPDEKLHDRRIGDMLESIYPHIDNIWKEIVYQAFHQFDIPLSFIHYDITSIYFEGEYEQAEKIDYGYSRDNKPECKQVNLRMNITGDDSIPLSFKVINGNTADRTTPIDNMHSLRALLDEIEESNDIIIVSDQAMLDRDVIVQYHQQDIGYLGPVPMLKEYEAKLMSISIEELKKHALSYRHKNQKVSEPARYYGVLSDVSISGKKIKQTVKTQALILYSTNKAKLDADKRTTLLERYQKRIEQISGYLNTRKYKNLSYTQQQIKKAQSKYSAVKELLEIKLTGTDGKLEMHFGVNSEKLAHALEKDGRYMLITNRELTPDEMLRHFKEQDKIEKRNMTIKGPIRIRPIFLHKQERIEALIFICMLALLVFSILELKAKRASIKMTGKRIIELFWTLTAVYTFFIDGSVFGKVATLNESQSEFLSDLDFPAPGVYLKKMRFD